MTFPLRRAVEADANAFGAAKHFERLRGLAMFPADELRTYVVNLRRRPDRRQRMQRILPADLRAGYTSDWDGPFDGARLDLAALHRHGYGLFPWRLDIDHRWWGRPLRFGEIGCMISHIHCWRDAWLSTATACLILEDDINLAPDFSERLQAGFEAVTQDDGPTLIYLGRDPQEPDKGSRNGIASPGFSYGTYGYMVNRAGIEAFLSTDPHRDIIPADEFLPAMYLDHPRSDVRARYPKQLRALAYAPPLVVQLPKREAGSDTELSEFVSIH
ncbi:glycosyltransferase family 25 protein [Nonomuraea sp. NPDC052265]|uniref:glycosyltransferase family 25 protein n=1 Tax=Nonomuraea sp. NPDC052265 TaxID=3364374 RepID=UPI0037C8F9E0